MGVSYVELHNHRKVIPDGFRDFFVQTARQLILDADIHKIDVYSMTGSSGHTGGDPSRLVILANCNTPIEGGQEVKINDVLVGYFKKDDRATTHQFNVIADIFDVFNDESREAIKHILTALNGVYAQANLDYSWKSTSKKEELTSEFTARIKEQNSRYIREDENRMREAEDYIRTYTRKLKEYHDSRIRYANNIETAKAKLETVTSGLIKDLDNIIAHPKVKELFIKDGKFVVHTEPLYMYHDKTGERYYLGNMRIEMNPQNTDVKFFGDNPRKSYWSETDPHPHVNGRDGQACLGNVSATIAELCSQMELYALTMIGIDFLEAVNTSDPAGRNVVNWDVVDDEGNIIRKGGTVDEDDDDNSWVCDYCEERQHEDETSYQVYSSYSGDAEGNGDFGNERYVCENCRDNEYTYVESLDEYIRDGHIDIDEDGEDEF